MVSRLGVDRAPDPVWFYCADCSVMYDGRLGHQCGPDDPLAPSKGTFLPALAMLVLYAVLVAAAIVKFGWPFR